MTILLAILTTIVFTTYVQSAGTTTVSFEVPMMNGNKLVYSFNKTSSAECLYAPHDDRVICTKKHNYKDIKSLWKYKSNNILYISVNCMKQTYYSYNQHSCICVNGSDAANPGKYKQNDDLHYCHLTTIKDGMFTKLSHLNVLDLSNNALTTIGDNSFMGLNSLRYLDMSNNPINSLPQELLCGISQLEILKLRNISAGTNVFSVNFIKCSTDLEKLIFIDLSDNRIETIPNRLFKNTPNIQYLILRNNNIKHISESAFYDARKLEYLDISLNLLPAIPRAFCDFLFQVKHINLSSNQLSQFNMNAMTKCKTAEVLDISNNKIKRIKGSLTEKSNLGLFNASRNGLLSISDNFLQNATGVERIDLSFNNLHAFSASVFFKLTNLKHLDLQDNKFTDTVDILNIFNNTQQLISLNLSSNSIGNVINRTFQLLSNLQVLDLSSNNLNATYQETFTGLKSLKTLLLRHNSIDEINTHSISTTDVLEALDLSHNRIIDLDNVVLPFSLLDVNLEQNVFSKFPSCFINGNVKQLNLKSNVIDDLTGIEKNDLSNLIELDLSFNQLNTLENVSFANMTSLTDLNLSFNEISGKLSDDIFKGTENLTILNLQKNYITNIDSFFSYPSTRTLKHVDFSYNTIESINSLLSHDPSNQSDTLLRELHFEHGYIRHVSQDAFLGFLNLRTVYLQNNMIKTLQPFNIAYGTEFKLQNNPLQCSCNMSWLSESYVQVKNRKVSTFDYEVDTCTIHPENMELPVRKVQKNQFRCKVEKDCDSLCVCYSYINDFDIDYVNCDGLIGNMPEILSRDSKVIYLDGNRLPILRLPEHYSPEFLTTELYLNRSQIGIIQDIFFSSFGNLQILDLSQNKISNLPKAIFNNLIYLKKLYLSDNNIKTISPTWLDGLSLKVFHLNGNQIQHIDQTVLSKLDSMRSMRYVRLQNNPWQCDCKNRDFRIWLKHSGKIVQQRYSIECVNDKKPLLSVHIADFECQAVESYTNRKGIVTVLIVIFICLVLLAAATIYYRRDILAVLYVKMGFGCLRRKYDTNKPYDAYLVYDVNDSKCSDWINMSLLTFLEKRKNPYKIVTTDRSKLLSNSPDMEYTQLQESKSCLFVINDTVMSNSWCVDCFHTAWSYSKKNPNFRIIIIVYGDIEVNLLEKEMRTMLSKGQYITARSRSVWDRLLYELPNPEFGVNYVRSDDDVSENDVIIYSAGSNNLDEYGRVSIF